MTVTASGYERRKNELYETERWVTRAFCRHFPVEGMQIWEPAAGNHLVVKELEANGAQVTASDIETYDVGHHFLFDFLSDREDYEVFDGIFTNPPYGKGNRMAVQFAEKALERCAGLVGLVLTAKFDSGSTRRHLFQDNPRFAAKIVLTDRISWTLDGVTGTEDHAIYVWTEKPRLPRQPVILYAGRRDVDEGRAA